MYNRWCSRVEEVEALQDLPAPGLQDFGVDAFKPPQVAVGIYIITKL